MIVDGAAALRSIPLGYKGVPATADITKTRLWVAHLSASLGAPAEESAAAVSRQWKSLPFTDREQMWRAWCKPGELSEWDLNHVTFRAWFDWRAMSRNGLYFREDDVDMSTNVDTITRTELWLRADGITVEARSSSWYSTSACAVM